MKPMQTLELTTVRPRGAWLVEASAGTGKTYTIAGLYLLLVAEEGLTVDQVLVVTFTKAATAELRERIRARLVEARAAFAAGESSDPLLAALIARSPEAAIPLRRLERAVVDFDQAAVFTIHGFCQRALAEHAFESAMPFDSELLADPSELVQEVVDDFWRREVAGGEGRLTAYLLTRGLSPQVLQRDLTPHLPKPYLQLRGPQARVDLEAAYRELLAAWQAARECWAQEGVAVTELLQQHPGLDRRSYSKAHLPNWLAQIAAFLAEEPDGLGSCKNLDRFTPAGLAAKTRSGEPPAHAFFACCELLEQALAAYAQACEHNYAALRLEALHYLRAELPRRKRRLQVQSYDDLLTNLHQAMQGQAGGQLVANLRQRYRAALIDEFQDTDPLQYGIFSRVFNIPGVPLFLVGDPKQAIYNFRGADVYAYLTAKDEIPQGYTLGTNWRSDPLLIEGVNAVFQRAQRPFLLEAIGYPPVVPAPKQAVELRDEGRARAPLRFWVLDESHCQSGKSGEIRKGDALEIAAEAVANEIARMLSGHAGVARVSLDGRPLEGGDVAVLVRKHFQGSAIVRALQRRGIACVQQSRDKVFASAEAEQLRRLLLALAEPGRESLVRAALGMELLGVNGAELLALSADEPGWNRLLARFQDYHQLWRDQGIVRCLRSLLQREQVHERLLAYRDGERRLTNLLHLCELLHRRECEGALGMEGLMNWFGERCRDAGSDEEAELRLESDEKLVKVVTIHASKGLEYPIVFCPFLWDGPERKVLNPPLAFHDPAQDFQAVLDFGSEQLAAADGLVREEALAEDLRLAYVALTRARHRCYVIWGKCNGAAATGLGWLLHGHRNAEVPVPLARLALTFKACDAAALKADLDALAAAAPAAIEIEPLPTPAPMHLHRHEAGAPALAARRFAGELRQGWRMSSFTALAGQHAGSVIEQPDYDPEHVPPVAEPEASGIFAFPRGGRPGSCLHAIFENWDFQSGDEPALVALVERSLARFGLSPHWTETVVHLVQQVLATPLGPHGMHLGSLSRAQRLDELEFYYPLAQLQAPALRAVLAGHGFAAGAFAERIGRLEFAPVGGFMKGFIDLVFEQNGRFFLADYKSNWLGARPQDYAQPRLAAAMAARDYYLQYLIYAVALHRYLRLRLPGYDYERHFGGVYYLFLRGMDPARPELGVYFDRPTAELIARLDRYLATAELTERVDVD